MTDRGSLSSSPHASLALSLAAWATALLTSAAPVAGNQLPIVEEREGWVRIDPGDGVPLRMRWTVVNPWAAAPEESGTTHWVQDECVSPEHDPQGRSAYALLEVEGQSQPARLELGEPGTLRLEGVYRHRDAVVAGFSGYYGCSFLRGEASTRWWTAVRLRPSLKVLEHWQVRESGPCDAYSPKVRVDARFVTDEDLLVMVARWVPSHCMDGSGSGVTVRWPVGEPVPCHEERTVPDDTPPPALLRAHLEVARFSTSLGLLGRVYLQPWWFPADVAVDVQAPAGEVSTQLSLPTYWRTQVLKGQRIVPQPQEPGGTTRPPLTTNDLGGVLPTEGWPVAARPCEWELPDEALERYSTFTQWRTLMVSDRAEIGILTLPCEGTGQTPDDADGLQTWLIRLVHEDSELAALALLTSTCSGYRNRGGSESAPVMRLEPLATQRSVRLEYGFPASANSFSESWAWRSSGGVGDAIESALELVEAPLGVHSFTVPLDGLIQVEAARSRWRQVRVGPPDTYNLTVEWGGGSFVARGQTHSRWFFSRDGLTWEQAEVPHGGRMRVGPFLAAHRNEEWIAWSGTAWFSSADGQVWSRAEMSGDVPEQLHQLVGFGEQLLALAGGRLNRSGDGRSWRAEPSDLVDLAVAGRRLYGFAPGLGVFSSRDGDRWKRVMPAAPEPGNLATNGRTFVLKSTCSLQVGDRGESWRQVTVPECHRLHDLAWTGREFVAVDEGPFKDVGVLFASRDGLEWRRETLPDVLPLDSVATGDSTVVVGGEGMVLVLEPETMGR